MTLMNRFTVSPGRDEAFHELWAKTAKYFGPRGEGRPDSPARAWR